VASLFRTVFFLLLVLLLAGSLAFFAWARNLERRSLYRPQRTVASTPADVRLRYQPVSFLSEDGKTSLSGWWIPSPGAKLTVLFCHGNSGNVSDLLEVARGFHALGCNLLLWDYRGYGKSDGRPGERGIRQDAIAAYDTASRLDPDAGVVVWGVSLGAAVAVRLAGDLRTVPSLPPPRALVAESGFASVADMARRLHPWAPLWLVRGHYASDEAASRLDMSHIGDPTSRRTFNAYRFNAELGDPRAMFLLAEGFEKGHFGRNKDRAAALWYVRAFLKGCG